MLHRIALNTICNLLTTIFRRTFVAWMEKNLIKLFRRVFCSILVFDNNHYMVMNWIWWHLNLLEIRYSFDSSKKAFNAEHQHEDIQTWAWNSSNCIPFTFDIEQYTQYELCVAWKFHEWNRQQLWFSILMCWLSERRSYYEERIEIVNVSVLV